MSHHKREYEDEIRAKGYRVTPQRLIILDAVCDIGRHATIGEITARVRQNDPAIDQTTIYRTLKMLTDVGLIVSVNSDHDGILYEIASISLHHHLVCDSCGRTIEIGDEDLKALNSAVQKRTGFKVRLSHLVLSGLCRDCQSDPQQ